MTGSGRPGNGIPADIRTDVAHPARVYDYWLGGKDNFGADQAAAEQVMQVMPEILDTVRGNRQFMVRAVGFLRHAGIRQFLDIGSGLPSSPNVHEIAQAGNTGARVVYVDHDPVVFSHAGAMTAKNDGAGVVWADLRDTGEVLSGAGKLLDFTRPVGLLFVGCLHHIPDSGDPAGIVARYLAALAPAATWSSRTPPMSFHQRRCGPTPRWPTAAVPCSSPQQGRDLAYVQRARAG